MSFTTRLAGVAKPTGFALALSIAAQGAFAQAPAPAPARQPQRPAAQPAAPAQAPAAAQQNQQSQTGPIVVQVKPEPSQTEWTKVCGKDQGTGSEICYTTRDFVSDQGQPVLAAAIYDVKGQQSQKIVRFLMPLGLLIKPGIRFAVDSTPNPIAGAYTMCFPNGCFAEATDIKDATVTAMKRGQQINVSVQNQVGREVTFAVPLAGFGKAFDGAAIDPKVLEDQQKRMQEELEKRSEELRKRLEQTTATGAPATPGAPSAAGAPTAPAPKP